ncbi:uncharacterized protein [Anabrus simplex]|uniref:uncharacterized protein n=1 Tax=Anabrus simplex TaxID=316456 RepID=UPI0035A3191E
MGCIRRSEIYFIISLILVVTIPLQIRAEEEANPFVEAAKALLQDQLKNQGGNNAASGLGAIGGLVQNFMQSDGGRQLGDMLLGATSKPGDPTADIISGLGSLIAGATNSNGGGGIDPQLIGTVMSMFSQMTNSGDEDSNNNIDVNNNEIDGGKTKRTKRDNVGGNVDWGSMLSLAGSFLSAQQGTGQRSGGDGGGFEAIMNILPMLMQSGSQERGETNDEVNSSKPSVFAPVLGILYDYWLHFTNSELGQTLWKTSGLEATLKLFTDKNGQLDMDRIYRSLENASFRKRWIRSLSTYVADWVAHISDPATQTRYLATAQYMGNSFLKAQGYSKAALFDPAKPGASLSRLVNAVFKRHFGVQINSATYIKPAVTYLQEVFQLGQAKGLSLSHLTPKEIESKLTDTINGEIIEPAMRVWRAYRYGIKHPQCDRYVICTVNQRDDSSLGTGLKPGVTKLASLAASWFLSTNTGTPFWQLYHAATEELHCPTQYPVDCSDFHAEEIKATTEYTHSEL